MDHRIPEGSMITGGEVMISKENGMLYGLKFWDSNKTILLESVFEDYIKYKELTNHEFNLKHD